MGLILKKELLLKWNAVNERSMSARFNSCYANLTVIQVYEPTSDADDESKKEFYEHVQREVEVAPRHDVLIVMEDLNAKIGEYNKGWEKAMKRHGLGRMNENRERLAAFCKITWISPNARDWNQIDHIIVNGRHRGSLMDNRTMRGANANSDHHIVMEKVRLKLCSTKRKRKERTIFNIKRLRDPCVKEVFRPEVSIRFQVLGTDDADDIEEMWGRFKKACNESAKKMLGEKRRVTNNWISGKTSYRKIEERRGLKEKMGCTRSARMKERAAGAYEVKDKEVKGSARADKRRWLNDLAEEVETAAKKNCIGDLYQLTRKIAGRRRNMITIKDKRASFL